MGIALGEGACRPAGTALIAEMFESRWHCHSTPGKDFWKFFSFVLLRHRGVANGIFSWGVRSCQSYKQTKATLFLLFSLFD